MKELIEGVDFYYENGFVVFTEKYHLEKGYCCGMNCRHCPYKNKPVPESTTPAHEQKKNSN